MFKGLLAGIVLTLAVIALGGYVAVQNGWMPANADGRPSKLEAWMAKTSLRATINREAPKGDNPLAATPATLTDGMKLYMANCAVCHGAASGKATNVSHGLYQKPPQLASDGVEDDPAGVTYWKIQHGIRLTGMPAYTQTLSENQIWQLTAFLQNMDHLPPSVNAQWRHARVAEQIAPASVQAQPKKPVAPTKG